MTMVAISRVGATVVNRLLSSSDPGGRTKVMKPRFSRVV